MNYQVINKSNKDLEGINKYISKFFPYAQEKLGFDKPVDIIFMSDSGNAQRILGKTAYYDPDSMKIVLYVDDRHPKDILRSLSHELVHHAQNCRGEFSDGLELESGYAQSNKYMRKKEAEAYLLGNGLIFRDFEDACKAGAIMISENKDKKTEKQEKKGPKEKKVSDRQWKDSLVYETLKNKWIKKEEKNG